MCIILISDDANMNKECRIVVAVKTAAILVLLL